MNRSMVQPWVSPSVPSLPTCSWKSLRLKPLALSPTPYLWLRFVDDTLIIHKAEHSTHLLQHFNSQDPNIQFTVEQPGTDGSIPFLDNKVTPGPNSTIQITVYRKPTHTDQYLHWDSNHFIAAKHSVYNTLTHRVKVVYSNPTELTKELDHLREAVQACLFPTWAVNNYNTSLNTNTKTTGRPTQQKNNTPTTTTPVSPPIKKTLKHLHGGTLDTWVIREVQKDLPWTGYTNSFQGNQHQQASSYCTKRQGQ